MTGTLDASALAALAEPRGQLREGLSALRNFAELSRSLRVGPRALGSVLPDVAAGCAPLREALRTLLDTLSLALGDQHTGQLLAEIIAPRIELLERELSEAATHPLNAKARLLLEQQVSGLARELDGVRNLLELSIETLSEVPQRVLAGELLRRSVPEPGGSLPELVLTLPEPDFEAELRPRLLAALLGIALELVAEHASGSLEVGISSAGAGFRLCIQGTKPSSESPEHVATVALPYLEAAVALGGGELSWEPEKALLGLVFASGHAMEKHV